MKTKITVNRQVIDSNRKQGTTQPPIAIRRGSKVSYASEIEILGPSKIVYGDTPLNCGARMWIETESVVNIIS